MNSIRQNEGRFAGSTEELILRAGLYVVILWLVACDVAAWYAPDHCVGVLKAVGLHALLGRAMGISTGLGSGLPRWLVVVVAFGTDVMVVLLLYPLAVYSYERGVRGRFLRETFGSTIMAASTGRRKVRRWGIAGLVFFVWFPFYMTGPLVGSVIGYFLGLQAWVTLTAVSAGTLLAAVFWVFVFDWLRGALMEVSKGLEGYIPLAVVAVVLTTVLAARIYSRRRRARKARRDEGADAQGSGPEEKRPERAERADTQSGQVDRPGRTDI